MQRRADGKPVIHFGRQAPNSKPIRLGASTLLQMMSLIVRVCTVSGFDDRIDQVWQAVTGAHAPV
jgi:hypothetical protein